MPKQKTCKQYYKELRSHSSKLTHILYVYNFTYLYIKRLAWWWRSKTKHIAHERATGRNPPIHNITADQKKKKRERERERISLIAQQLRMFCLYENIRGFFFFTQHYDRRCVCVFVRQLSTNTGISVWRIVWVKTNCCWMSDMLLELM